MKNIVMAATAAAGLLLAGCVFIADNTIEPQDLGEAHRAGGGMEITYIAPDEGVISLVDKKSGRNILSKSVIKGEEYYFSAKEQDPAEAKQWGVDLKKANFVLYFYPNPKPPMMHAPQPPLHPLPPLPEGPQPPMPPVPPAPQPQP